MQIKLGFGFLVIVIVLLSIALYRRNKHYLTCQRTMDMTINREYDLTH